MSDNNSWRCVHADWKFCPAEGCPKSYGCARKHGWKLGDESPAECTGKVAALNDSGEKISVR